MKRTFSILLLILVPVLLATLAMFIGPSGERGWESVLEWIRWKTGSPADAGTHPELTGLILWEIRFPRIMLAFLTGGALSLAGVAMQAIFRNPLASPYILGMSSGAAFGAALALAWGFMPPQASAFLFAALATFLCYLIAVRKKKLAVLHLVLGGIIVSGIFTALLTLVQYLSDPFKLQTIVHWTMGNLHNANNTKLWTSLIPAGIGVAGILIFRWRLNLLSLGDQEARSSGMNVPVQRGLIILLATLATSGAIAVSGIIGFIDLIVPHMVRMVTGADHRKLAPVSFVAGGCLLLVIDTLSRILGSYEIPAGVITMLIGAPVFIFILKRSKIVWGT